MPCLLSSALCLWQAFLWQGWHWVVSSTQAQLKDVWQAEHWSELMGHEVTSKLSSKVIFPQNSDLVLVHCYAWPMPLNKLTYNELGSKYWTDKEITRVYCRNNAFVVVWDSCAGPVKLWTWLNVGHVRIDLPFSSKNLAFETKMHSPVTILHCIVC